MWISRLATVCGTVVLAIFLSAPADVAAAERVLAFDADVSIQADGSLLVTETIRVRAEGRDIRQGIYRDFPTTYRDRARNRYRVDFAVLDIRRDGRPEPYHVDERRNGVRVYIGKRGVYIEQGEHEYRLRYRTNHQLGYFDGHDELYWNVTGSGWAFAIDRASATVHMPQPVNADHLRLAWYTGPQGASGRDAEARVRDASTVEFSTTSPLAPGEGLTVAVGWPKGLVAEPGAGANAIRFFRDNGGALAMVLGLLAPLAWYLWAWNRVGRDPRKGVIIPRFSPPEGLSPAGCRYVLDMALSKPAFTSAVVSLGVKGWLKIEEEDGDFTLYRQESDGARSLSAGERAVLESLLPNRGDTITLDHDNHREFRAARGALESALRDEHRGRLFNLNALYALPAMLASVVGGVAAVPQYVSPWMWVAYPALSIALHVMFVILLRAPTEMGRRVMDGIEGFRMYLGTAEEERLERMRSPQITPEVFEMFLPFAFALGVENSWCASFEREFPESQATEGGYRQHWYRTRSGRSRSINRIGSSLGGALTTAIAAASTPPGSTSGSGGGGFSGGGGGGGGGGGW